MEEQVKKILISKNAELATNGAYEEVTKTDSGNVYKFSEMSRMVLVNDFFKGQTPFKEFIFHDCEKELRVSFPFIFQHEDCYVKWVTDFICGHSSLDALKCLFILGKYEFEQY